VDDESYNERDQNQKAKFVEGPKPKNKIRRGIKTKKREGKKFKFKNIDSSIFFLSFFLHFKNEKENPFKPNGNVFQTCLRFSLDDYYESVTVRHLDVPTTTPTCYLNMLPLHSPQMYNTLSNINPRFCSLD
jgi:hypothetical protein